MKNSFLSCCLLLFITSQIIGQVPVDSLIGYWPFNGNANDHSGNNNHGTVSGATLTINRFGIEGRAYSFDGSDKITIPTSSSLDMDTCLSFSVWIKSESLTGTRMILGKSNYSSTTNYLIRVKPGGYIQWEYDGYTNTDTNPLQVSTWHHLVVTANDPGKIKKVYLDNKLIKTTTSTTGPIGNVMNPLTIGYASYNDEYFIGAIDDIRMYNKELSLAEVEALYNETCNTFSSITQTACDSYTSPSGKYSWTESGTYKDTIPNAEGCDSILTIVLTIKSVDVSVSQEGSTLTANAPEAVYQWLDCNNSNAPIPGETQPSFTPDYSGHFAVKVTQEGCVDTSSCFSVNPVGILENTFDNEISVFPNPTNGSLKIDLGKKPAAIRYILTDINGRFIRQSSAGNAQLFEINISEPAGAYLLTLISEDKKATIRVVKK